MKKEILLIFDNPHSRAYFWGYTKYILFENHIKYRGLDDTREITIYIPNHNKIKYLDGKERITINNIYIKFILFQDIEIETRGKHYTKEIYISTGFKQVEFCNILQELLED